MRRLESVKEISHGIYFSTTLCNPHQYKVSKVNPTDILKHFPNVKDVVYGFSDDTLVDDSDLKYYNNWEKGLAKRIEGMKRYFAIPDQFFIRNVPDRTYNPDAFAIAYNYSRVINQDWTGTYSRAKKILIMPKFAMPILLYRVLLLETLASGMLPTSQQDNYVFEPVSKSVAKEINRILCNSIVYE